MNNKLEIDRLINFIKRQYVLNITSLVIGAAAVFGSLLMISELVGYFSPQSITNLIHLYLFTFILCGLIFSSRAFNELHNPQKGYAFLTLPVSTLEKFIGSWLLTSLFYTIIFSLVCLLIYSLACMTGNRMDAFSEIFNGDVLKKIATFLVMQSIFFLGSLYFRNNNFLKTILSLFLFTVIVSIYSGILGWLVLKGNSPMGFGINSTEIAGSAIKLIKVGFYFLLGPFMLIVSYYRLKERQI